MAAEGCFQALKALKVLLKKAVCLEGCEEFGDYHWTRELDEFLIPGWMRLVNDCCPLLTAGLLYT
jgi:hypothetical protein